MATETKSVKLTQLLMSLILGLVFCTSAFSPHHPLQGFGIRFCALGFLIAVWIYFWRSLAQRFQWRGLARWALPSELFVLPLTALHNIDPSLGSERGDWFAGIMILAVIGLVCSLRSPGQDTSPARWEVAAVCAGLLAFGPLIAMQVSGQRAIDRAEVAVKLLSDSGGADFGSYIGGVQATLEHSISAACASALKTEPIGVQVHIRKSGQIGMLVLDPRMKYVNTDRACISLVGAEDPFPPLPAEFNGPGIVVKARFQLRDSPLKDSK